jgi:hypothetical protein
MMFALQDPRSSRQPNATHFSAALQKSAVARPQFLKHKKEIYITRNTRSHLFIYLFTVI